VIKSLTREHVR